MGGAKMLYGVVELKINSKWTVTGLEWLELFKSVMYI